MQKQVKMAIPMNNNKCDVAIYTRVSTDRQVKKGHSLEAQQKAGIEYCNANGLIYCIFEEAGKSASKENLNNRPKMKEILDLAEDQLIKFIYVTELDRISRNMGVLELIKKILRDKKIKIITTTQIYDLEDEESDFISDLYGLLAKKENTTRVKRSKRAKTEAALKGKWVCSVVPFGYSKIKSEDKSINNQLISNEDEANVYNKITELCLEGDGVNTIARKLNEMSITTKWTRISKEGKIFKWKAGTILRILKSPMYKGEYIYKGNKISVLALITPEKWELLQAQLKKNSNNAKRNTRRFYLLRGLLYCKKCGQKLFGLIKPKKGMKCYSCLSKRPDPEPRFCGLKNISIDKLDNLIWTKIKEIVTNSDKLEEAIKAKKNYNWKDTVILQSEVEYIDKKIQQKKEEKNRLLELYSQSKAFTIEELDNKAKEIESVINNLYKEKESINNKKSDHDAIKRNLLELESVMKRVATKIDNFSDQEKHDFLHLCINKIIIDYDKNVGHTVEIEGAIPIFEEERDKKQCAKNIVPIVPRQSI